MSGIVCQQTLIADLFRLCLYTKVLWFTDNYDWCIVPDTGYDVILLAGIAVVVACVCQGRLSNLMVLLAGEHLVYC